MDDQFIKSVVFDWDKVDDDSYVKKIEGFRGIDKLKFNKSITFFSVTFLNFYCIT